MVKFRTDVKTVAHMQEMMDRWMALKGQRMELELSRSKWMRQLGDYTMAFDLDYLRAREESETCLVCELGGKAPTKQALVYRFICQFEGAEDMSPIVMDVEEGVYDEACRTGRWEVIPRRQTPVSVATHAHPAPGVSTSRSS